MLASSQCLAFDFWELGTIVGFGSSGIALARIISVFWLSMFGSLLGIVLSCALDSVHIIEYPSCICEQEEAAASNQVESAHLCLLQLKIGRHMCRDVKSLIL